MTVNLCILVDAIPRFRLSNGSSTEDINLTEAKQKIEQQKELIKKQNLVIKSLSEGKDAKQKRILKEVQRMLLQRKKIAAQYGVLANPDQPLHALSKYDVPNIIKCWVLNDVDHIDKSKAILTIIMEQSLSGEQLITLDEHLRVVLEKAILQYMTHASFDRVMCYLEKQLTENVEEIKAKTEQDISELIVDYVLNDLIQQIVDKDINGAKIAENNNLFVSWIQHVTGWEKNEIVQINSVLLKYKTRTSKELQSELYNKLQDEFDDKIARLVCNRIDDLNLDLPSLQLKIKNGELIEQEQETLMNVIQSVEENFENFTFIHNVYKLFAQCFTMKSDEWTCFNCGNCNYLMHKKNTKLLFCILCGIKQLTSTIYALKGSDTFAMVSKTINKDELHDEVKQEEKLAADDCEIDIVCPNTLEHSACPSMVRLSKQMIFYQSWINRICSENNGKDDIAFTTHVDTKNLNNEIFTKIFITSSKRALKMDRDKTSQLERLLKENIINIQLFHQLKR
eukprot:218159_1